MEDKTRREFLRESSGSAFAFSISSLLPDWVPGAEASEEGFELGEEDLLLFDRGPHPSNPMDSPFADFFSLTYAPAEEGEVVETRTFGEDSLYGEVSSEFQDPLRREMGYPEPSEDASMIITESNQRDVVADMDDIRTLPESHPLRRMAEQIPEPGIDRSGIVDLSDDKWENVQNEMIDVLGELAQQTGDINEAFDLLEEDAETVSEVSFSYEDRRHESDRKLEILLEDAVELPHSYSNAWLENQVYHGEKFDAVLNENKATLQFHGSERVMKPENILSESEYEKVARGHKSYEELDRDQQVLFQLYDAEFEEKTYNF